MTVITSRARKRAFWSVKPTPVNCPAMPAESYDEVELVELVAGSHPETR